MHEAGGNNRVFALFCVSHEEGVRAGRSVQLNSLNAQPPNNVDMVTFTIKLSSIGRCLLRSENKKISSLLLKFHKKNLTASRNIIVAWCKTTKNPIRNVHNHHTRKSPIYSRLLNMHFCDYFTCMLTVGSTKSTWFEDWALALAVADDMYSPYETLIPAFNNLTRTQCEAERSSTHTAIKLFTVTLQCTLHNKTIIRSL